MDYLREREKYLKLFFKNIYNPNACRLYLKIGYEKSIIVDFRKGQFWCMEKKLENSVKK